MNWKPHQAFGCAIALIVVTAIINFVLQTLIDSDPSFTAWLAAHDAAFELAIGFWKNLLWLGIAYAFSNLESFGALINETGLSRRPNILGWFFALAAILFSVIDHFLVQKGVGTHVLSDKKFYHDTATVFLLYLFATILISPIIEELVMRGFLYRAFRQNYGIFWGVVWVFAIQGYFHWGLIQTPYGFAEQLVAAVIFCCIREFTGNTWNCILFHSAHNAMATGEVPVVIIGTAIALLACRFTLSQTSEHTATVTKYSTDITPSMH